MSISMARRQMTVPVDRGGRFDVGGAPILLADSATLPSGPRICRPPGEINSRQRHQALALARSIRTQLVFVVGFLSAPGNAGTSLGTWPARAQNPTDFRRDSVR